MRALGRQPITRAAALAGFGQHATFGQVGQVACGCGLRSAREMDVFLRAHSAGKSFRAGVKQLLHGFRLPRVHGRRLIPEVRLVHGRADDSFGGAAGLFELANEPKHPVGDIEAAALRRVELVVVLRAVLVKAGGEAVDADRRAALQPDVPKRIAITLYPGSAPYNMLFK